MSWWVIIHLICLHQNIQVYKWSCILFSNHDVGVSYCMYSSKDDFLASIKKIFLQQVDEALYLYGTFHTYTLCNALHPTLTRQHQMYNKTYFTTICNLRTHNVTHLQKTINEGILVAANKNIFLDYNVRI